MSADEHRAEVVVVGLGPIGAGALRHLARRGADAIGIGPPGGAATGAGPFSSHHDAGRITRRIDRDHRWMLLASRAMAAYPALEDELGARFHHPTGMAYVRDDVEGIEALRSVATRGGVPLTVGDVRDHHALRGELALPPDATLLHEAAPAGRIDPQVMVAAQLHSARRGGARIVDDAVRAVHADGDHLRVDLRDGAIVRAESVVLATGAASNDLLRDVGTLALDVIAEPVVRAVVDDDTARRLASLPTLIWMLDDPDLVDAYLVPVAQYPDGTWQVKLGATARQPALLHDAGAVARWMTEPVPAQLWHPLRDLVSALLPDVVAQSWESSPCLITDTATGLPYVDVIADGVLVATGGNGSAAKSGDAIGALAADLVLTSGRWADQELARDDFAVRWGSGAGRRGSRR